MLKHIAIILFFITIGSGYKTFMKHIPNGDRIPNPDLPNALWRGVGHLNGNGGGPRNAFGLDFAANGFKWDACLCEHDSDGDGVSNGQELGDPDCIWTPGKSPARNNLITHPGICEPLTSTKCQDKNQLIQFSQSRPFDCPATRKQGVTKTTYRFPPTKVPAEETNFFCMYFPLNVSSSEHVIAFEPVIDNQDVMHHTIVYGCRQDMAEKLAAKSMSSAMDCKTSMAPCLEILLIWTVGVNGLCHPDIYGELIGDYGFEGIWMEHHYNNPYKVSGMTDSTGMTIYHTSDLRSNDAAYLIWGTSALELPVMAENYTQEGGCMATCTKKMEHKIYLSEFIPHMHYYGRGMEVTHVRPGEFERHVFITYDFSFDKPITHRFETPLEFFPGDELKVVCNYTTTSAGSPTYYGFEMEDEMCYLGVLMYPFDLSVPGLCESADGVSYCQTNNGGETYGVAENCDLESIDERNTAVLDDMYNTLVAKCDSTGLSCGLGCQQVIDEITANNECLNGTSSRFSRAKFGDWTDKSVANMMISCSGMSDTEKEKSDEASEDEHDHNEHANQTTKGSCVLTKDDTNTECLTCGASRIAQLFTTMAMGMWGILVL